MGLLGLLLTVPGAGVAAPVQVTDDLGHTVALAAPPRRVVSLQPSLTEALCVLGGCDRLVGVDRYADWPAEVQRLPRLGGLEDPQVEGVVALRPDLVLLSRSSSAGPRLRALGLPVLAFEADSHADVRRVLSRLASLLGTPAAAEAAWATVESQLDEAARRVPARLRGRTVYFEVASTPHAAGAASFIGETLARLGLVNVVPPALGPFPQLNPEFVVRARPDLVMGARAAVQAMPSRPGWQGLAALRGGRHCGFPPGRYELLLRPGPRLGEAAGVLADCLQGLAR
ncbi:helical backbone metal receptor [Aquabacterium sp. J223]|nr:helical backbone metal receptor [Aquabacterium sp. J223]UUX95819.1 helical backbone metal receptor [Aquabacterium sp. J223]